MGCLPLLVEMVLPLYSAGRQEAELLLNPNALEAEVVTVLTNPTTP